MSDSNPSALTGKAPADPQTTNVNPQGQTSSEGEDATPTAFDPSLLDTVVSPGSQPTDKATAKPSEENPYRQQHIAKWNERILNEEIDPDGIAYDLDHPKMPKWVKDAILETGETKKSSKPTVQEVDELEYRLLLRDIPALTTDKQKKLAELKQEYQDDGMDKYKALKHAMRYMERTDEAYKRGLSRSRRASAPTGDPIMSKKNSEISDSAERLGNFLGVTEEDRKQYASNKFTPHNFNAQ